MLMLLNIHFPRSQLIGPAAMAPYKAAISGCGLAQGLASPKVHK